MKKTPHQQVLVTGAGGFVGQTLVPQLLRQGFSVTALIRSPHTYFAPHPDLKVILGDITHQPTVLAAAQNCRVAIHLAAQKSDEPDSYQVNVLGARNLIAAAQKQRLTLIINLSTLSTKLPTRGLYGQTKAEADRLFTLSKVPTITVHSSIIFGWPAEGVFRDLLKVSRWPLVPLMGDGQQVVFPLSREDVATALIQIINRFPTRSAQYDLGGQQAVTLKDFLQLLRHVYHQRSQTFFVSVPVALGLKMAKLSETFFPQARITTSKVLGSTQLIPTEVKAFQAMFGFRPQSLKSALTSVSAQSLQFEPELAEARVFFNYLARNLGITFNPTLFELQQLHHGFELVLGEKKRPSRLLSVHPGLLGPLDAVTKLVYPDCALQTKLLVTAALFETHPASAPQLLPQNSSYWQLLLKGMIMGLTYGWWLVLGTILMLLVPSQDTYE